MIEEILSVDTTLLLYVQEHFRFEALTSIMRVITFLGDGGLLWILTALALLLIPRTRRGGLDVALGTLLPWLLVEYVLKELTHRPRPFTALTEVVPLIALPSGYSFPSGHACAAFAAATALTLAFPDKSGNRAFIPAVLISLSRVYLGVHYPLDILAGAAFGMLGAWIVYAASHRYLHGDLLTQRERRQLSK